MSKTPDYAARRAMLNQFRATAKYLRLYTTARSDDGSSAGVELAGGGYNGGVLVDFPVAPSTGEPALTNSNTVQMTNSASDNRGVIQHGVIANTQTGAIGEGWNVEISPPLAWTIGQPVNIAAGDIKLRMP